MKIVYHHRIRSKDGQYVHLEELVNALTKQGHEIILVGPTAVTKERFGSDGGIVATLRRLLPGFAYELLEFCYAFGDYLRLARAVFRHRPDFIYERYNLFLPSGIWVKRHFNVPLLLEVNAPLYQERSRYQGLVLNRIAQWTERYAWLGADQVLPVTRVLAEYVRQVGVPESRITVVPNGIDPGRFADLPNVTEAKQRLGLQGRLVLGFIGFMREWHGLERLVDFVASNSNENIHLLMVGDGPARSDLESRAKQAGVESQLQITGVVQRDEVAGYLAAFDIALQPMVVDYASPLKLFEYMVLGKAILAPASPNIREVLTHDENALLFDPNSAEDFNGKLEGLISSNSLRQRLAERAQEDVYSRQFTWHANAERVIAMARALIDNPRAAENP